MKIKIVILFMILTVNLFAKGSLEGLNFHYPPLDDPNQMRLELPVNRWDEGIPLGNGMTGILMWGQPNFLNLSLDRGDLWDNRIAPELMRPDFKYKTMVEKVLAGDRAGFDALFDAPYNDYPYPTKLSGGRLVIEWEEGVIMQALSVDYSNGMGNIEFSDGSNAQLIYSQKSDGALLICDKPIKQFRMIAPGTPRKGRETQSYAKFKELGYPKATSLNSKTESGFIQQGAEGFSYCMKAKIQSSSDKTFIAIAMTSASEGGNPLAKANKILFKLLERGEQELKADSISWWNNFQSASSIMLPDLISQAYYNYCEYLYGAGSRRGAPPMPLQGVWTADSAGLPPWKGDFHWDLNMQLNYWGAYTAGLENSYLALTDYLWQLKPVFEKFSSDFYEVEGGIAIPGVMSLSGQPMTGWGQYALSPTNGVWAAQHFYWDWKYNGDIEYLKNRAYPFCRGLGVLIEDLLETDFDGKMTLPISTSPEIFSNSKRSWLQPNSNYDLMLISWLYDVLAEMAKELNLDEQTQWQKLRSSLHKPAVDDENRLMFSPNEQWRQSHRHHSALIGIYPLQNIDPFYKDQSVVTKSLDGLRELGTRAWTGYSFSWAACLEASSSRGNQAQAFLDDYYYNFISRNGFHINGDQGRNNLASYKGRPFTLEGNFAAMHASQLMLLQNRGDKVILFPALPSQWKEASFTKLRSWGGACLSSQYRNGRVTELKIECLIDGELKVASELLEKELIIRLVNQGAVEKEDYLQFVMKKGKIYK